MNLKPGDRVKVYGTYNAYAEVVKATVEEVHGAVLKVTTDDGIDDRGDRNDGWTGWVHEKQCRKLKPKQKREPQSVWIKGNARDGFSYYYIKYLKPDDSENYTEFMEVIK